MRAMETFIPDIHVLMAQARRGDCVAQRRLGLLYELGHGVGRDRDEAARWYLRAALQGDAFGRFALLSLWEADFDRHAMTIGRSPADAAAA